MVNSPQSTAHAAAQSGLPHTHRHAGTVPYEMERPVAMGNEQSEVSTLRTPAHASAPTGGRLTSWGGFAVMAVGTTLAALLEMGLSGNLGWLTGAVFVVLCIVVALTLRLQDITTAIISPPLAYLVAVILSAQLAVIGSSGNFWLLQATTMLSGLAFNAQWVFLGTGLALVIMIVRRVNAR